MYINYIGIPKPAWIIRHEARHYPSRMGSRGWHQNSHSCRSVWIASPGGNTNGRARQCIRLAYNLGYCSPHWRPVGKLDQQWSKSVGSDFRNRLAKDWYLRLNWVFGSPTSESFLTLANNKPIRFSSLSVSHPVKDGSRVFNRSLQLTVFRYWRL